MEAREAGAPSARSSPWSAAAAGGASSREELLALLAARDAQLAAALAAGDAALAERDSARAERDAYRRLLERPSVRAFMLGERLLDVLPIVAAMGFAAEVSHCLLLCGDTWRKGDKGATNDMLARSLERQCGASVARAAKREDIFYFAGFTIKGTTQLIRAAMQNDLPRVLQLVQLGAPLELKDEGGFSALHWACERGHEHIARALLDGKYEGCGAEIDARAWRSWTPLMRASAQGHEGVVRLRLARGARQELQSSDGFGDFGGIVRRESTDGWAALHWAVDSGSSGIVSLLCAAPCSPAAFALRDANGRSPLGLAIEGGHAACEAVLRARGAPA